MPSVNIYFKEGETCESLGRDGFVEATGICATWSLFGTEIMLEPIDSGKEASGCCCVKMTINTLKKIVKLLEKEELEKQCQEYTEIGDTIKIEEKTYKCIANLPCNDCSFAGMSDICVSLACAAGERPDSIDVAFKQVEE